MAQVPYSPVPNNVVNFSPTPNIHVNTPDDVFGGNIGRALSNLGQVTDKVGDELTARGLAMQQLNNEANAREAGVKFEAGAGQIYANFTQQMGKNAGPEAYQQYQKDLADLRTNTRKDLASPDAQKMYDADSYGIMGRLYTYGAKHSGDQLRQYGLATSKANAEESLNSVNLTPTDPQAVDTAMAKNEADARYQSSQNGASPEETQQAVEIARSKVKASQIAGLAREHPDQAAPILKDAIAKGDLRGEMIPQLQELVDKKLIEKTAPEIASGINDGTKWALGDKPVDIDRAKDAISAVESGGAYNITNKTSGALGKYQVMPANLQSWLRDSGQGPMTPAEFLNNPGAQDKVFETEFGKQMTKYGNFNDALSVWFTGKPMSKVGNPSDGGTDLKTYLTKSNAVLAKSASLQEKVVAGQTEAAKIPNAPPLMDQWVQSKVIQDHNQQAAIARSDEQQTKGAIDDAIVHGAMTVDAIKSTPDGAQAWDRLSSKDQLDYQQKLVRLQKQDNTPTDARSGTYHTLYGMAHQDPDKFLDTDLMSKDLTADDRKELQGLKTKIKSGQNIVSPHVSAVLASPAIRQGLSSMGIQKRSDDPDRYDKFTGALADEISNVEAGGKPVSYKEAEDIGRRLMQDVSVPGAWWGTNQTKPFDAEPPSDISAQLERLLQAQGKSATPEDIRRAYAHRLYLDSLTKNTRQTDRLDIQASPAPKAQ